MTEFLKAELALAADFNIHNSALLCHSNKKKTVLEMENLITQLVHEHNYVPEAKGKAFKTLKLFFTARTQVSTALNEFLSKIPFVIWLKIMTFWEAVDLIQ